jgi:hypothetical protein
VEPHGSGIRGVPRLLCPALLLPDHHPSAVQVSNACPPTEQAARHWNCHCMYLSCMRAAMRALWSGDACAPEGYPRVVQCLCICACTCALECASCLSRGDFLLFACDALDCLRPPSATRDAPSFAHLRLASLLPRQPQRFPDLLHGALDCQAPVEANMARHSAASFSLRLRPGIIGRLLQHTQRTRANRPVRAGGACGGGGAV